MATRAEVIEYMRLNFVEAMRAGQRMCYFVGQEDFSFQKFSDDLNFPVAELFNWSVGRQYETLMKVVREDEKYDNYFELKGTFTMLETKF